MAEIVDKYVSKGAITEKDYLYNVLIKVDESEISKNGTYTIPEEVEAIMSAFVNNKKLKAIFIGGKVKRTFMSFMRCPELETAFIGPNMEAIETDTFRDCPKLKNVTISEGVEYIRLFSFKNCVTLEEIILPDTVKAIGGSTFMGCRSLKKVKLPKNLTAISGGCFLGCESLEYIDLPETITEVSMGSFLGCGLRRIVIPQATTKIGEQAFEQCKNLEAVKLPLGVEILEDAFKDCSPNLKLYWTDKKGKVVKVTDVNGNPVSVPKGRRS